MYYKMLFYNSFDNVDPTEQNYLLGVDISVSMTLDNFKNVLTPTECAISLAMVLNKQNPNSFVMGFSDSFINLDITYKDNFQSAINRVYKLGFGSTDCSLPMKYAMQNKLDIDKFVVITDNKTNTGDIHPSRALKQYRSKRKKNSALIVCTTSVSQFSIADPKDPKQLDIVGFSPNVPRIISSI